MAEESVIIIPEAELQDLKWATAPGVDFEDFEYHLEKVLDAINTIRNAQGKIPLPRTMLVNFEAEVEKIG